MRVQQNDKQGFRGQKGYTEITVSTVLFTDTMCAPRLGREAFRVFIPKMLTGLM